MQSKADGESYADWLARLEARSGKCDLIDDRRLLQIERVIRVGVDGDNNIIRDLVAEIRRCWDVNDRLGKIVNDLATRGERSG